MTDVKHAIVPATQLGQGSGADGGEQGDTDDAEDDVFLLDSFG